MKFFSLLLAIYTCAITFLPCNDVHAEQKEIPQTVQAAQEHHEDESDFCSPFCVCSCCQGFVLISLINQSQPVAILSKEQLLYCSGHQLPSVVADHWQPPRLG